MLFYSGSTSNESNTKETTESCENYHGVEGIIMEMQNECRRWNAAWISSMECGLDFVDGMLDH